MPLFKPMLNRETHEEGESEMVKGIGGVKTLQDEIDMGLRDKDGNEIKQEGEQTSEAPIEELETADNPDVDASGQPNPPEPEKEGE